MSLTQTPRKVAYDKSRAKLLYQDFVDRRLTAIKSFGNKCQQCGKKATRKGFHFHDVEYHPVESNYPRRCNTMWIRLKRLAEVEAHPERFQLLCNKCHSNVDRKTSASPDA